MKKKIRIKDIANKADVSTGTVDRVLHNRGKVSPEVKERVLKVIEDLGYERNILASALAYNRTVRVASLLPSPEDDLYWSQTNQGVLKAVKAVQHYGLVLEQTFFNYGSPASFVEKAKAVIKTLPDGLLFPPMFADEAHWLIKECDEHEIPYVIINTNLEGAEPLCYIGQDSYQSGVLGARLLNFGLNDGGVVCILNLDYSTKAAQHLISKEQGFRDYFEEIDNKRIQIIREDFDQFDDKQKLGIFLNDLVKNTPLLRGIFVTNSRVHKVLDCLNEVIIDKNIKIVGFDLIDPNLNYLRTNKINFLINQNPADQGFRGIYSLFKALIRNEEVEKSQYLPLDIVVKENVEYHVKKLTEVELVL